MSGPIVDAHLHLYRTAAEGEAGKSGYGIWEYGERENVHFSAHPGDVASARAAMAAADADYVIVTNLHDIVRPGVPPADDLRAFNRWLCGVAAEDPRFVPFMAVDPNVMTIAEIIAHLEEMAAAGARGIKIHPPVQRLELRERTFWPILEACVRLDLAVVTHAGPSRDGSGIGTPESFRPLLEGLPDLRIWLAHMGGAAWRELPGIARDFPAVHFDLCEIIEWLGAPNAPTAAEMVELIRSVGPERVMMGSDFPWYDIDHTVDLVRGLPGLTSAEIDGILGANAVRFLRLGA